MNAETLSSVIQAHGDNRALDLLARTTHAMRADPYNSRLFFLMTAALFVFVKEINSVIW